MQRIATRLEEAAAAAATGEFGFTVEEAEAAEAASLVEQEEPLALPRKYLRKAVDVAGRQTSQQPPCRATRSTAASTIAAGAGSSRSIATAPAKRTREPTPPPPRTGGEPDFDLSALSSDEEEEE